MSSVEERDRSPRVFDHVDLHPGNDAVSARVHESVLTPLGIPKLSEGAGSACVTNLDVVGRRPPTTGLHVCFHARSRHAVDAFRRAGVEAGSTSDGEPGYRDYRPGHHAAYLLDPDGNGVEALYGASRSLR